MLNLPDGTILFTDGGSQLWVYKPDGSPIPASQPTIYGVSPNGGGTYKVTGALFAGISRGSAYGDDAQMDSNFPLVRLTDGSGNVTYVPTYNWSSTTMQSGSATDTVLFNEQAVFPGNYTLQVVVNGTASSPISFGGPVWVDFKYSSGLGFYFGTYYFPYNTLAAGVSAVSAGGIINIKAGDSLETSTIIKAMQINASGGSAKIGGL
jgi:hypothetical protein